MKPHLARSFALRRSLGIAGICMAGAATLVAFRPAVASSFIAAASSVVTCATTTACVTGTNAGTGPGLSGTSTSGYGVVAASTNLDGISATSKKKSGVVGISNGTSATLSSGVLGVAPYTGVVGRTVTGGGVGVQGEVTTGVGISGSAYGSGYGVDAYSAFGIGVNGRSNAGIGVRAHTLGGGFSVVGTSDNGQGSGADFEGGRYGIVGRANSSGFPLVLTDSSYQNVFYVSGTGDVFLHGGVHSFVHGAGGATVSSYTANTSEPTMEDTGSAQLIAGVATVKLDPTFASTIDASAAYRVFLTPDGDTRGLFVAQKTPRGFSVRETQGGRSTLAFDYRIVAKGRGQAGKRMMVQAASDMPKAPIPPASVATPTVGALPTGAP